MTAVLPDVLRSEFTKLAGLRSTWWLLGTACVITPAAAVAVTAGYVSHYRAGPASPAIDPTYWSLDGVFLAQLLIGIVGVLTIGAEFGSGQINVTFTAVPQRRTVFGAKAVVVFTVALAAGWAGGLPAFLIGQAVLSGRHLQAGLGQPGVLRAVLGSGLYLAVLAVLALGLGTLIRHTAGAVATLFALLLVLPAVGVTLPPSWQDTLAPYLPGNAGPAVFHVRPMEHVAAPWAGFGAFCGYTALVALAAVLVLPRRDVGAVGGG
jgi:ABC-2 type transport system permease protein